MTSRFQNYLCGVCRGVETGIGVRLARDTLWLCSRPQCLEIAQRSGNVTANWTKIERRAAIDGAGNAMGQFFDEKGFGDLFDKMPPEVWAEACIIGMKGYRDELVRLVDEGAAPF